MRKNILSIIAIVISVAALAASLYTINVVNDLKNMVLYDGNIQSSAIDNTDEGQQTPENETAPSVATHPFDESLVGSWSNGYWEMQILEDSTFYLEGADNYGQGENKYIYTGYIENNKVLVEYQVNCSLEEYLINQQGYERKEAFETADLVREATDSFQIHSISNVQPSLSFRRM